MCSKMKFCGEGFTLLHSKMKFVGKIAYTRSSLNRSPYLIINPNFGALPEVVPCTGSSVIVKKRKCPLQNVYVNLCLSASDSQNVLWCRHWWFDRHSTTHQHHAATLTTAGSGCINGKVWGQYPCTCYNNAWWCLLKMTSSYVLDIVM